MMRFLLCLMCFSAFFAKAQTQYKSFRFTTDDGLPSNIIYSIAEDNKHNIVLGTDNGFSVFNGNDFKNYNVKDGLNNPYIVSVCSDKNTIWLINYGGRLQRFENNKIKSTPIFSTNKNDIISFKNNIFLSTQQNRHLNKTYDFVQIDKSNFKIEPKQNVEKPNRIAPAILMQNGLEIVFKNDFVTYKNYKFKLPDAIKFIHKIIFRSNDVFILDDDFLYILDFDGNILSKIKLPANLSANAIFRYDFITDQSENCWLSIQNQGLFVLKNNVFAPINETLGLKKQDNINFLLLDSSGKIWIATNEKGLICIPSTLIETILLKNADNYFTGFATTLDQQSMFFSSRFDLYSINKNDKIQFLEKSKSEIILNNFDNIPIYNTIEKQNNIWNKKHKLLKICGRQIIEKNGENNFITLNRGGAINIIKPNSLNVIVNKIAVKEKIKSVEKHNNEYYFNNGQEIDIRTFDNKFIYRKRKLKFKINGFIEDFTFIDDTMLIAANNAVYKVFNEKIIDSITKINNIKLDNVRRIKQIESDVYLCAGNGLFKISKNGNRVLNKYNFLPTNDVYNVANFHNNIFVATNAGLVKINQEFVNNKSKKPTFEIVSNNKIISKLEIANDQESAAIELNIQNFYATENQIIHYKIDNSTWIQTKTKTINFQSIASGNHKVQIRVKDVNSDWETQILSVYKEYPFYLKWWFFMVVALFIFMIYKYQIKKINQKKTQEIATNNQIIELRQNALSAMMNPHFIFNSLSAGQYFINSNQLEKSSEHVGKLARLVRLFLSQSSQSFISISDEIKRLKLYVELEQVRFNDFDFELNIDPEIDILLTKIPNMIVQPFIENAILHGISGPNISNGKIELNFSLKNDIITIEVIDNGFGIDVNKPKNDNHISKGIAIIEERLLILKQSYPEKQFSISQDFAFSDSYRKGHKVVIVVTILD